MDKQFLFLNFCTRYSSKGAVNKAMSKEACFTDVFRYYDNGRFINYYTIVVYKYGAHLLEKKQNNAFIGTDEDIRKHLNIAKAVVPFTYNIIEKEDRFIITININAYQIQHRYVLSWVRYLYEFPFNMYLREAYKLKKVYGFRKQSIINLFNIIGVTAGRSDHGTDIHAIGPTYKLKKIMTCTQIKRRILSLIDSHNHEINAIFKSSMDYDLIEQYKDIDTLLSFEVWDNEKDFKKRVKLYKNNYKVIKNLF